MNRDGASSARGGLAKFAGRSLATVTIYGVLIICCGIVMIPLVHTLTSSVTSNQEAYAYPPRLIPSKLALDNYVKAWAMAPFGRFFLNSTAVALLVTFGQVVCAALAAYSCARLEFPGRTFVFQLFLAATMIPIHMRIIPSYIVLSRLHWLNTYQALTVPFFFDAFSIFLLRQQFLSIPRDYDDAAKMDGCGHLGILLNVLLPMSGATLATVMLLAFIGTWNSYLWPLLVTNKREMFTVQVGLAMIRISEDWGGLSWPVLMAAVVIVSSPCVIVYLVAQRQLVHGLVGSGLKL